MSERLLHSFRLCTEPARIQTVLSRVTGKHNLLPAARLEQLLFAYPIDGQTVRFFLLQDQKGREGVLGFCGSNGIFVTEKHFSPADLAKLLQFSAGAGDLLLGSRETSRLLPLFLPQRAWQHFSGDNFCLPKSVCRKKPCALSLNLRSCPPTYDDIGQFFTLFQSGFAGFAGRTKDAFYLEQNHLLRHRAAELLGLYDKDGRLLCGCEINLGSDRLRYLFDLTTKKEARGKGLAAALILSAAAGDSRPLFLSAQDKSLSDYYASIGMVKAGGWAQFRRL